MKILLLSFHYVPDSGPDPPLMSDLAAGWLASGHQVTVVCAFPHYQRACLDARYRRRWFDVERPAPGYRIVRCRVHVPRNGSLWQRALNYLSFLVTGLFAVVTAGRHDLVFAYTPPPTVGALALVASWLWRAPLVDNVQDIYPDVGVKLGVLRHRWLVHAIARFERLMHRCAVVVCVICEGARANLLAKGVPAHKVLCIPNWVDTDLVTPHPRDNRLACERGWSRRFVVLYSGNIGRSQGMSMLLDSLPRAPDVCLAIAGRGEGFERFQRDARARGLAGLEFHAPVARDDLALLLSAADVALVMMRPELASESVPSKLYAIMSCARPILLVGSPHSDAWHIVTRAHAGLCVAHGDQRGFEAAIMRLHDDAALRVRLGDHGRRYVIEHGSRRVAVQRYVELVASLQPGQPEAWRVACER